jgi:methyltransferase
MTTNDSALLGLTASQAAYLGFLLLLGAERLLELALSRRNAARLFARGAVEVGQGHFRVMALFHTLFLAACAAEVLLLPRPFPGGAGLAALGVALLAQALRYWAITTLGERWNTRIIVEPGAPPVTGGPYRYLRHPNYVAVVAELAAVPLVHGAWATALLFSAGNALLLFVRIRAEERALGPLYAQAFAAHPRFIPGGRHEQ